MYFSHLRPYVQCPPKLPWVVANTTIDVSTSKYLSWSCLVSPPSHDVVASSCICTTWGHTQSPKPLHCSSSPFSPLPLPHTPLIVQKNEGRQQAIRRKKYCFTWTLISNIFLESSSPISITPYLESLLGLGQDMITLF
jgi:hypothetical protein